MYSLLPGSRSYLPSTTGSWSRWSPRIWLQRHFPGQRWGWI